MKKKLLALLVSTMMVASLVACGEAAAPAEAPATETSAPAAEKTDDAAADKADDAADKADDAADDADVAEGCSDEVFAVLQEGYEELVAAEEIALEVYSMDEIEADEDLNALFVEADAIVAQIGEIEQSEITDEEAIEVAEAMDALIEAFGNMIDAMEVAE